MNSRLASVVLGSFYLSVLIGSYLLAVLYPFFAPYGQLLIPLVANFCIGYFVKDVYTAVKIIIVGFSLQIGILLALSYASSVSDAFFGVTILSSYYTLQVPLGIAVSLVGTAVREESSNIIALCVHLVKELKHVIKKLSGKV